jgi:hypothetical protein
VGGLQDTPGSNPTYLSRPYLENGLSGGTNSAVRSTMYCFPHKIFGNEIRTVHTYQQKYSPRKTFQQLRTTKKSIYDLDLHNNNNTILTA